MQRYLVLEQKIDSRDVSSTALERIASIEQRISRNTLQVTRRSSKRVAEDAVRRLHKARNARPGIKYHPAVSSGVKLVQASRKRDRLLADRDACQSDIVKRGQVRILRQGSILEAIARLPTEEDVAVRVGVDEAVGETIGEAVGDFAFELRREGELAAAEPEDARGADEEALVDVTASEGELRDLVGAAGNGGESERVLGEVADGHGAVAVGDSVEAILGLLPTFKELELRAHGRRAFERGEGGGCGGVEDWADLLVALLARLALEPEYVAACVDRRNDVLRWRPYLQGQDQRLGLDRHGRHSQFLTMKTHFLCAITTFVEVCGCQPYLKRDKVFTRAGIKT